MPPILVMTTKVTHEVDREDFARMATAGKLPADKRVVSLNGGQTWMTPEQACLVLEVDNPRFARPRRGGSVMELVQHVPIWVWPIVVLAVVPAITLWICGVIGGSIDDDDFERAVADDSVKSLQIYLKNHPDGRHVTEAEAIIADLELGNFALSPGLDSVEPLERYMREYPEGRRIEQVKSQFLPRCYDLLTSKHGRSPVELMLRSNQPHPIRKADEILADYAAFFARDPPDRMVEGARQTLEPLKRLYYWAKAVTAGAGSPDRAIREMVTYNGLRSVALVPWHDPSSVLMIWNPRWEYGLDTALPELAPALPPPGIDLVPLWCELLAEGTDRSAHLKRAIRDVYIKPPNLAKVDQLDRRVGVICVGLAGRSITYRDDNRREVPIEQNVGFGAARLHLLAAPAGCTRLSYEVK